MDGRKALLRSLIVASLATTGSAANLVADDFIRPPAKTQSAPARVGTIKQPAAPAQVTAPATPAVSAPIPTVPAASAPLPSAPVPSDVPLDLTEPKPAGSTVPTATVPATTTNPIILAARPAQQPVPAKVVSSQSASSPLNWQPRGGRPSLSVDPNKSTRDNSSTIRAEGQDPLALDGAPQVPTATPQAAGEVRLVVPTRPEDVAAAELLQQRRELAAKISNELTSQATVAEGNPTNAIEPGPGWQAVGEELKQHVSKCEELLTRRAYLSAMQEADQAIVRLIRVLDLKQNRLYSEPIWSQAQQALREAQEFTSVHRVASDTALFTRLIQSHETPVLKDANVSELPPLVAAQHYRAYAEQCLVAAAQGHPWFCELYYCLGRSLQAQAESNPSKADSLLLQSVAYFRAAQAIDPTNVTNVNQLSYVLLKLDRPAEAFQQLQPIVQQAECPLEAWQNLAQASARLGDTQTEKWAVENYMAAKSRGIEPSGPVNTLVQVSEEQFRAMSPRTIGPSGALPINVVNSPGIPAPGAMNMNNAPAPNGGQESSGRTASFPRTGFFR